MSFGGVRIGWSRYRSRFRPRERQTSLQNVSRISTTHPNKTETPKRGRVNNLPLSLCPEETDYASMTQGEMPLHNTKDLRVHTFNPKEP
jgi:hypothetical protein